MTNTITIDITVTSVGSVISLPITVCNTTDVDFSSTYVEVTVPSGVQFLVSSVPKGTYDLVSNKWTIGQIKAGNCFTAEIQFVIVDDTDPTYKFEYTFKNSEKCESFSEITQCIIYSGLSCSQLRECDKNLTTNSILICSSGFECSGDVSIGDEPCPYSLNKTYKWIDIAFSNGDGATINSVGWWGYHSGTWNKLG